MILVSLRQSSGVMSLDVEAVRAGKLRTTRWMTALRNLVERQPCPPRYPLDFCFSSNLILMLLFTRRGVLALSMSSGHISTRYKALCPMVSQPAMCSCTCTSYQHVIFSEKPFLADLSRESSRHPDECPDVSNLFTRHGNHLGTVGWVRERRVNRYLSCRMW